MGQGWELAYCISFAISSRLTRTITAGGSPGQSALPQTVQRRACSDRLGAIRLPHCPQYRCAPSNPASCTARDALPSTSTGTRGTGGWEPSCRDTA